MIDKYKVEFDKAIEHCKKNVSVLRTGRANASVLDGITVDVYGTETPLEHVASISVPEPKLITISPWDKNNMKAIEEAINKSQINLNPVNDGQVIRLNIPSLTEESRKEIVKELGKKLEDAKIQVRQIREKVRDEVTEAEKNKEISQDDKFIYFERIDKMTNEYVDKIEEIGKAKEKELMTI